MPPPPPAESGVFRPEGEKPPIQTPEQKIAAVLDAEDRVIEGRRAQKLGLTKDQLHKRVKRGAMYRKQRGVYTAGNESVGARGEWRAAVTAVGTDAFLDAGSAVALFGAREPDADELTHVVCLRDVDHRKGVRVHSQPDLPVGDTTMRHGIRTVTAARALLGYAATGPGHGKLRRALNQMLVDRHVSLAQVVDLMARSRGRRGVARLARAMLDGKPTRSELEDMAVAALRTSGAEFETNAKIVGCEVDVLFRDARVVVEIDSRYHDTPMARADDEAKDARLVAAGYVVERVRHRDLTVDLHRRVPEILALVDDRIGAFSS